MPDTVDKLLNGYAPEVGEIATKVREVILRIAPQANEKAFAGWRTIGYGLKSGGMKAQFCAIGSQKGRVNVYFPHGVGLDDPEGLLEGAGKYMRHVKVRSVQEAQSVGLQSLIAAAANLPSES